MAITYPLTFPTAKGIAQATFRGQAIVGVVTSIFTGEQDVQEHAGQFWTGDLAWPAMKRATAEEVLGFLFKLNGRLGTFLMEAPNGGTPRGTASSAPGTPVIAGASQTGNALNIDGCPAGAATYLLVGDYIQLSTGINSKLHKVLNTVVVDSAGAATIDIWPNLRSSPVDASTVVVDGALGAFRLATNTMAHDIDEAAFYGISVPFVEAI